MNSIKKPGADARREGRTRYFGVVCAKHPGLKGERHAHNANCVLCARDYKRTPAALAKARRYDTKRRRAKQAKDAAYLAREAAREERRAAREAALVERARRRNDAGMKRLLYGDKKAQRTRRAHVERDFVHLAVRSLHRYPTPRATRAELQELWDKQVGRCALTGMLLDGVRPHLDHKTPVAKGGASTIDNLQFTHPAANYAKLDGSDEEFQAWLLAAAESLKAKLALEALLR